jgi:uncharacterized membrane protein/ketosteroid isomerase-like protein
VPDLLEPNIHPILVHFALGLVITSAMCLSMSSISIFGDKRHSLERAGDWMLLFGTIALIATVGAGFQAYYSVGHDEQSHAAMTTHRNWAVPTAIAIIGLGLWRLKAKRTAPSAVFIVALLAATSSLTITGWWGGNLVFGHGVGVARLPMVDDHGHSHSDAHDHSASAQDTAQHDLDEAGVHDHGWQGHAAGSSLPSEMAAADISVANYPATPRLVVEAFETALRGKDAKTARALLAEDVVIAENGGVERSAAQYAGHHMISDMAFTSAVDITLKQRNEFVGDVTSAVVSQSQLHGSFEGKTIHSAMMETILLSRVDDRWRISHIHWSSAPLTGEHEH